MDKTLLIEKVREDGHTVRETESTFQIYAKEDYIKELEAQGWIKPEDYIKASNNIFRVYKEIKVQRQKQRKWQSNYMRR